MVTGINHITLSVRNMQQSYDFYTRVLGFQPVAKWPKGAYLLAGDVWVALLVDEKTREARLPEYTHIAFAVTEGDFKKMSARIAGAGAEIWQENRSEGDSLYFVDPNGHKLELHVTDLDSRIKSAKENPWDGLEFFV
ncbi:glutathione transferase [candidate division WOR_3 bacterium SM23_60]|uniref:Glutathione transferase n=1 Tax=candidate division WOR_3 bacterium SM23_60 TaxID=1703780 RepID=A0A0S8GCM1_UNCW3|nr:MAG: glutathione transferase [candidate division WOR_3 bacterium SM23_60]